MKWTKTLLRPFWRYKNWLHERPWYKSGTTRQVVLFGSRAVKIPITCYGWSGFLQGLLANMQETRWSNDAENMPHVDHGRRLARVVFAVPGGWLVVQERALIPRNFKRKFTDRLLSEDMGDRFSGLPFDPTNRNFGFIGRRLVLIDYGS